jgi:hypothetical protein
VISSVSIGATHDLALLTAFLDLKNYQLNLNTNKDDFIEDYGKKLDLEIRKRYNIR